MLTYRKMEYDECAKAAGIAARAFFDYEFFINYVPDDNRRLLFLNRLITTDFRLNYSQSTTVFIEEDGVQKGVISLTPPDYKKPSDIKYLTNGFVGAARAAGVSNAFAWNKMNDMNDAPCHAVPGAWYLYLLTIEPEYEGQGIGTRALKEWAEPFVRSEGGRIFTLVTNSEINRKFYTKNGFEEFHYQEFQYKGNVTKGWSYKKNL